MLVATHTHTHTHTFSWFLESHFAEVEIMNKFDAHSTGYASSLSSFSSSSASWPFTVHSLLQESEWCRECGWCKNSFFSYRLSHHHHLPSSAIIIIITIITITIIPEMWGWFGITQKYCCFSPRIYSQKFTMYSIPPTQALFGRQYWVSCAQGQGRGRKINKGENKHQSASFQTSADRAQRDPWKR